MGFFFSCDFSGTNSTLCNELYKSLGVCPYPLQTQTSFFDPVFTDNSTQQGWGWYRPEAWTYCTLSGEKEKRHSWRMFITSACYCMDGWYTGMYNTVPFPTVCVCSFSLEGFLHTRPAFKSFCWPDLFGMQRWYCWCESLRRDEVMLPMASLCAGLAAAAPPQEWGSRDPAADRGGCSSFQTSLSQEATTVSYSSLNGLTPFLQAFFMLPVPVHPASKCHSLALPVNGGTDQQIKVSFLHWVWLSVLCKMSTLPSLQVVSSHHALGAVLHQWQLHMSPCSMAAGCPFSLGGPHAASASCKHLSMPASLCILLHLSVSPCTSGWPEWGAGPVSNLLLLYSTQQEPTKSDEARLAGHCAFSVCSETSSTVCPIYLIILLLSQVPFTWNRQVFLWCSSVSWQRDCASEGHAQVLRQTKKHAVLFIL